MFETQVFSHNDIQENNIMIDKADQLWLIDYEYSQSNFRMNDIANLMAETIVGYDEPPASFSVHPEDKWDFHSPLFTSVINSYLGKEATEEEISMMRDEVQRCTVWQHFYWGVWSLNMIPSDDLESALDFALPYAKYRFE